MESLDGPVYLESLVLDLGLRPGFWIWDLALGPRFLNPNDLSGGGVRIKTRRPFYSGLQWKRPRDRWPTEVVYSGLQWKRRLRTSTVVYSGNALMKALWLQSRAFLASGSWIRQILPRENPEVL